MIKVYFVSRTCYYAGREIEKRAISLNWMLESSSKNCSPIAIHYFILLYELNFN